MDDIALVETEFAFSGDASLYDLAAGFGDASFRAYRETLILNPKTMAKIYRDDEREYARFVWNIAYRDASRVKRINVDSDCIQNKNKNTCTHKVLLELRDGRKAKLIANNVRINRLIQQLEPSLQGSNVNRCPNVFLDHNEK